jgi:ATP-binding protein involved in chromosome partitioning
LTGAVVVTTPQEVALAAAIKGVNMFINEKVSVPILGVIENMAWFTPAELPENKYYIFGKDGGKRMADAFNIPLIGQIPLVQGICESGDEGLPVAMKADSPDGQAFLQVAAKLVENTRKRNEELPVTRIVETHK